MGSHGSTTTKGHGPIPQLLHHTLEPTSSNHQAGAPQLLKLRSPRAHVLQQEKPLSTLRQHSLEAPP